MTTLSPETLTLRLAAAGIPAWTLPKLVPSLLSAELEAWVRERRPHPQGVVLYGSPGTGKTVRLAQMLEARLRAGDGREFCWGTVTDEKAALAMRLGTLRRRPAPIWFTDWVALRDLFFRIRTRRMQTDEGEPWTESECREELDADVSLLGIDDFDMEQPLPRWMESLGVWLCDRPLRARRLVLTVNSQPAEWPMILGERVADRLLDPTHFLLLDTGTTSRRR